MKRVALCILAVILFISVATAGFAASSLYIGNKDSKIYHTADCSHGQKTAPENRVYFYSRESAESSGYHRCHFCGDDIVEPGHGGGSSSNKNPSSNSGATQQGSQINSQSQQSGGSQAGESRTFWEKAWEVVRVILIIVCVAAWPIVISLPFSAIYQTVIWLRKRKQQKKTSASETAEGKAKERQSAQIYSLESSLIKLAEYYEGVLYLTFTGGSVYAYYNLPVSVFEELVKSKSPGSYYHENIKGKYPETPYHN